MKIQELYESKPTNVGFYDPENDNLRKRETTDTRKQTLTLKHLNKLNKYRRFKEVELAKTINRKATIYAPSAEKKLEELEQELRIQDIKDQLSGDDK